MFKPNEVQDMANGTAGWSNIPDAIRHAFVNMNAQFVLHEQYIAQLHGMVNEMANERVELKKKVQDLTTLNTQQVRLLKCTLITRKKLSNICMRLQRREMPNWRIRYSKWQPW